MKTRTPLTRAAGLARLQDFTSRSGRLYAERRNTDPGPTESPTTSTLSPYLRRRLILEEEVVAAVIENHGIQQGERFVQEVFWRTYFKGYLETRPSIWADYLSQTGLQHARIDANSGLRLAYTDAVEGRTGIEGFDDWARELVETGWLHNHARMWFASIWIFTLRLPWALGAEHFLKHLLDGDPASNTLSWRWVAGLHTKGKCYAARAENISRYTNGRFAPTGLNETPQALTEEVMHTLAQLPQLQPLPTGEVTLLVHLDDLHPESFDLSGARVADVIGLVAAPQGVVEQVRAADLEAMTDALARAAAHFGCEARPAEKGWTTNRPLVSAWAPVGPTADAVPPYTRFRRGWDNRAWPLSTRGFFQLKSAIPHLLAEAGIHPSVGG